MILIIAAICFAALCFNVLGAPAPAAAKSPSSTSAPVNITSTANLLISDSGTNISIMNKTLYAPSFFGLQSFGMAQAVKFTPPKQDGS